MNLVGARKPRKCKSCRSLFWPRNSFHRVCGIDCALTMARGETAKANRIVKKAGLERLKTRRDYLKQAQAAFNRYIRARDYQLPCISCQRHHQGQWHAGHYRSVGAAPELRFHEANVHRQCAPCNAHKSGNLIEYRINLVRRIGADQVQWLEGERPPKKYTEPEIRAIEVYYRAKARELEKARSVELELTA